MCTVSSCRCAFSTISIHEIVELNSADWCATSALNFIVARCQLIVANPMQQTYLRTFNSHQHIECQKKTISDYFFYCFSSNKTQFAHCFSLFQFNFYCVFRFFLSFYFFFGVCNCANFDHPISLFNGIL